MKKALLAAVLCWTFFCTLPLAAQSDTGELHLTVTDSTGLGVKSSVTLNSEASQYSNEMETDEQGHVDVKRLPFGVYELNVQAKDFAPLTQTVEIRSSVPANLQVSLKPATVSTSVTVSAGATLINPHQASTVNELGQQTISERPASLPGRSLQDLVNSQPGWLFEGSGVLHPRGVEYQTQFVVDGIPLTDNRSPGFAPEITASDVEDLKVYTAGIPAEFGRKMGGVIQIDTLGETEPGFHGKTILSGGSYHTASAYTEVQYTWKRNTIGFSGNGSMTDHYLNPVVPENFTNAGTTAGWTASYERDLTPSDRITFTVRHGLSRFQVPNELDQQQAGQRVDADNFETMGTVNYQHIFSANVVGWLRGMVRENHNDLNSNALSTPVIAFQHNEFKEGYFSGAIAVHSGRHNWKAGVEFDNTFLNEQFNDIITDPSQFDPGTAPCFPYDTNTATCLPPFRASRPQLEQAAYVQDTIRLGHWSVDAGLRWDHYQLLVNENAVSPRVSIARYFPAAGASLHFSYDRIFQTPSFTNILLSSSPDVVSLNPTSVLRLPVKPAHGDYYEAGVTKGFAQKMRVDVNYFLRRMNNFPDDDNLLNTAVAFPTAWDRAVIYGAEAKIEVPKWGRFSGWASYSYQVGMNWLPITGGLLLGSEVANAGLAEKQPVTQDQRHTLRTRVRYQATSRLWFALGAEFNSGLPFEYEGTQADAIASYGPVVVSHLNFDRGRVEPVFKQNASVGVDLYNQGERNLRLQADCTNLSNVMDVLDFGGLFSGNAIGPKRSFTFRLIGKF
jgi:hypothetical protein